MIREFYRHVSKAYQLAVAVTGFWSITMYNMATNKTFNLVPNPIHCYSIGGRTRGLKKNPDGSLTIYIQSSSPGPDKESNWPRARRKGSSP